MRLKPTTTRLWQVDRRGRKAFTLMEVLAALLFMAIVIPVAVEGLSVANLAGEVGQRKEAAARIAGRVLNEMVVTGQLGGALQNGVVQEGAQQYQWTMRSEPWSGSPMNLSSASASGMNLVTIQIAFPVQGRDYEVRLSTLVGNSTQ